MTARFAKSRPVKFEVADDAFLRKVSYQTDLSISDLQRRSVKLLKKQVKMFRGYSFILDLK
jgi:hypothetical protein